MTKPIRPEEKLLFTYWLCLGDAKLSIINGDARIDKKPPNQKYAYLDDIDYEYLKPLSKGNALTISNAVLLCKLCNTSKGAKNPVNFYTSYKLDELIKKIISNNIKYISS